MVSEDYPTNLIACLLYGCGLRVAEPHNLRIKDVNLERFSLVIAGAKGCLESARRPSALPPRVRSNGHESR
ncbi:MAG: hypothetical protein DME23_26820 [Verrucomicrobia bacterium]|nr:MAG: hypothetical protein DME23_26820 [Verrucomicrobiota bacterium]